ncbi:hypothetical protein ACFB49_07830 [Sphingomonas sp. DBB INV C78]|uniref:sugar phosphate isomerase/epimerase family protein n=1 Tax=Sphingomonas sp. DBB INV C78 TaxID=3349434 RepID=UPI0036D21B83
MAKRHAIAMASGIMPEATPLQLVEAAARAGFDFGGMWIEPDDWTIQTTRDVKAALRDAGLKLLDVEVVWIKPGPHNPDHDRIVEIGAELGARNVLCVSSDPDRSATRDKLGRLIDLGHRAGIRVNLEFGLFTEVKTINAASALLQELDLPAAGLLVDALHWARSGGTLEDIAALPSRWLSYAQFCDAPEQGPDPRDDAAILEEAIDGRMFLGEGGLPLRGLAAALPATLPFAIEQRSKPLRDDYPDLNERAKVVLERSRAFLEGA